MTIKYDPVLKAVYDDEPSKFPLATPSASASASVTPSISEHPSPGPPVWQTERTVGKPFDWLHFFGVAGVGVLFIVIWAILLRLGWWMVTGR